MIFVRSVRAIVWIFLIIIFVALIEGCSTKPKNPHLPAYTLEQALKIIEFYTLQECTDSSGKVDEENFMFLFEYRKRAIEEQFKERLQSDKNHTEQLQR